MRKYVISGFADEIDESFDVQLEFLNLLGVKFMELRTVDGKGIANLSLDEAGAANAKLVAAGVGVSAIGSPIGKVSITEDFAPHFELFKHVVKLTKIFDTQYIRMFSFFIPTGENPQDFRDEVISRLSFLRDYAAANGVILLHENEKDIYGDTAARCHDLMKNLYCDNFKAIFDFANFVQCGEDTLEAFELLRPYIHYIHIKDASAHQVVPAGMGDGNVERILSMLLNAGFSGVLSLEPHLSDFAGFSALENTKTEKSEKFTDSKQAWHTALCALKAILYNIECSN